MVIPVDSTGIPYPSELQNTTKIYRTYIYLYFQRLVAAFLAISDRFFLERLLALALPPFDPNSAAADLGAVFSSASPVAIFPTRIAAPITSAGLFSPFGPRGISDLAYSEASGTDHGYPGAVAS
jgi:hypothetical protein